MDRGGVLAGNKQGNAHFGLDTVPLAEYESEYVLFELAF